MLILAAAVAGTSAARADELSELLAAVAGSMSAQKMANDVNTTSIGTGKSHYTPKPADTDLDLSLLDGVYWAMKRELTYPRPTLARQGFYRPVPGMITSLFGWRPQFQRVHHGVDLSLQVGDTVRAAVTGNVTLISYDHDGYGHYVVMQHDDGMETVYGHLEYPLVSQGQMILAGQPIGIGGNTGNSTGPHLHFETRLGGVAVDPMLLFDFYGSWHYLADDTPKSAVPKGPVYSHQSKSLANEKTYIVRYGDTLKSIARQAGISVMKLCQLNMLKESDNPPVGRMLKLSR